MTFRGNEITKGNVLIYMDIAYGLHYARTINGIPFMTAFSHPDCTVGPGISPESTPEGARGLSPPVGNFTAPRRSAFFSNCQYYMLRVEIESSRRRRSANAPPNTAADARAINPNTFAAGMVGTSRVTFTVAVSEPTPSLTST